ncbi:hypothetical protein, partial [Bacteroides uniformis]|uniref:hypothetical protein n=1 Tax=Bacteroides uniformis TaxID=820 RepID=UPI00195FB7C2
FPTLRVSGTCLANTTIFKLMLLIISISISQSVSAGNRSRRYIVCPATEIVRLTNYQRAKLVKLFVLTRNAGKKCTLKRFLSNIGALERELVMSYRLQATSAFSEYSAATCSL